MKMMLLQSVICSLFLSCGTSNQEEPTGTSHKTESAGAYNQTQKEILYENYVTSDDGYDIFFISKGAEENEAAEAYFYYHFKKRTPAGAVLKQGLDDIPSTKLKVQFIDVQIDDELGSDYVIEKRENKLTLKANSKKTLYWLFYQYFQDLSEKDSKVNADGLPPAIVNFEESKKGNFAFNYREPYLKANLVKDYDVIVNTNHVEKDWGIWGHQLFNLVNKNPKDEYYSIINGELNKNQICFSNSAIHTFLENYIIDNFGEKKNYKQNFVISPADNALVCTCNTCSKLGNTKGDASPAVIELVNKMAIRFPNHQFFTIDYLSVHTPPNTSMPKNTGIIISSIDIPRKVKLDPNNRYVKEFESKVNKWKKVIPTVYVWDYISNFDDYLTPFATLSVCKTNFNFYKNLKVNGIFANGAGYEYSTFNAVHTYVLAALMQDPTLDVNRLVNRFCKFYYGTSGPAVAAYIIGLEDVMQSKNFKLQLYSGVEKMTDTYLDKKKFFEFYDTIGEIKNTETEEVGFRMNELHTGLSYSAMQIQLANKFNKNFGFAVLDNNSIEVNDDYRERYKLFLKQFEIYDILVTRERGGSVPNYLKDVQISLIDTILHPNLLKDALKVTSELDEDYKDDAVLTDGIPGLATNYHTGWLLVSAADLTAEIRVPKENGLLELKLNFLLDERLKLRAPEKIEVFRNNIIFKTIEPRIKVSENARRITLGTALTLNKNDEIKIKVYRDKTYKKFAVDEIYF